MEHRDALDRIQFQNVKIEVLPDGRQVGRVILAWGGSGNRKFVGVSERAESELTDLECSAEATLRALETAVDHNVKFSLLTVEMSQHVGAVLVVVSISTHTDEAEERLVGSCLSEADPNESAVRAVLKATNRLVGSNFIYLH